MAHVQYQFADFIVSPARRTLSQGGHQIPLIPRYFDLLVMLLERRHEAVRRQEIFDRVWSDVVVSDGALTQGIRTLRRALGDTQRDCRFIQTVSRHGYRFVFPAVIEEPDTRSEYMAQRPANSSILGRGADRDAAIDEALERLIVRSRPGAFGDEEWRDAAETLHSLGTADALGRLGTRAGHERARARLREARWAVSGAGPVPLLGQPGGLTAAYHIVVMRLRGAAQLVLSRWGAACAGGAAAGVCAGIIGGLVLVWAARSEAPSNIVPALALVGGISGAIGAAGIGAGLSAAEALARSWRATALIACGAAGGAAVATLAHLIGEWAFQGIFGADISAAGGALEGLVLGAAAGAGYALGTRPAIGGGMAAPRGRARLAAAVITGCFCAVAGMILVRLGGKLVGSSLEVVARSFQGSHIRLQPLARLFGEREVGFLTRMVLAAWEAFLFGFGLVLGITHRPHLSEP